MANNPMAAPFSIVGSTGTDANGNPTARATINGITYTCSGISAGDAFESLGQLLVMIGCDPGCSLTVGALTTGDIINLL